MVVNSFLTSTCDLDACEVVDALTAVGAHLAARQLEKVVQGPAEAIASIIAGRAMEPVGAVLDRGT